uniref:Uncharacterized protein n=1 Tax=uncultured marine virus TaxID=186617 RepID=A0A0F7L4D9_9VIRU|nr:hypothetical protein [uncultured marine virus]
MATIDLAPFDQQSSLAVNPPRLDVYCKVEFGCEADVKHAEHASAGGFQVASVKVQDGVLASPVVIVVADKPSIALPVEGGSPHGQLCVQFARLLVFLGSARWHDVALNQASESRSAL